jgi:hypothetical protein
MKCPRLGHGDKAAAKEEQIENWKLQIVEGGHVGGGEPCWSGELFGSEAA